MEKVTVRVPATTANLGPGFDCFGCALTLYTDVTFEKIPSGFLITGCAPEYAGEDNLCYAAYRAVAVAMGVTAEGVHIHIDADIPICRGLGSSAALLVAGAMGANALHGNLLTKEALLKVTNAIEGHPDNLAPALYGGLTASLVENGVPVTASFPLHRDWIFLALVPDFPLSTALARSVLPERVTRADAIVNISHVPMVLKAFETGDERLLSVALTDRLHQPYRRALIPDYGRIEETVRALGGCFCLSGAGPTLLVITKDPGLAGKLEERLKDTEKTWRILPLRASCQGARIL